MADGQDSQEKTEDATPRKLRDARKKGQVAKSRDLTAVFLLLLAFICIHALNPHTGKLLEQYMISSFERIDQAGPVTRNQELMLPILRKGFETLAYILFPILIVVFFGAILISFMQVGASFSVEPIKFQLNKINPIQGFKNLFKLRSVVELIKSAIKITIVFLVAYFAIKGRLSELLYTVTSGVVPTLMLSSQILAGFIVKVCIFFIVIGLFDFLYQRWQYMKDLRMSKYEVMQEYKRDEGDPMLKSHRRQMHQELTSSDMARVAKSDVVVVNPVHLAIAIEYDRQKMNAPQIAVKGQRLIAEQIKRLAKENQIPIVENVPLAHALFELEISEEVPENLYEVMAEVLCFVYRLKQAKNSA